MTQARWFGVAVLAGAMLSACGAKNTGNTGQTGTGLPGTGLPGTTPGGGTTTPGGATTGPGATGVGTNPAGTNPSGTLPGSGVAGTGVNNPMGPGGGTGGMTGGGATGGMTGGSTGGTSGGGTGMPSGTCDKSMFLADCMQGSAQWGTPQQAGPCSSGVTTYGVKKMFGPYGVRSDYNVGKGFETGGSDDSAFCVGFIASFAADPKGSADLQMTHDLAWNLYTVFYPACMPDGETFPLITWGNGTCAMPEGYGPILRYVASNGYIVIAANDREVGTGASMSKGLDYMLSENDNPMSKFYHKINKDKIGAMGHSQGGGATASVAVSDSRIKSVILFNAVGGGNPSIPFLTISGDDDIGAGTDASGLKNGTMALPTPAAWLWFHQVPQAVAGSTTGTFAPGHLTLMMESERVVDFTLAWWDMQLKGKADAKKMFVGAGCTLCDTSTFGSPNSPYVGLAMPAHEYGSTAALQ